MLAVTDVAKKSKDASGDNDRKAKGNLHKEESVGSKRSKSDKVNGGQRNFEWFELQGSGPVAICVILNITCCRGIRGGVV